MPEQRAGPPRFAIVGFGAITEEIMCCMRAAHGGGELLGVLVRPQRLAEARARAGGRFPVVDDIEALLAPRPDVVLECAGHGAVGAFGPRVLASGSHLLLASTGALADPALGAALAGAARDGAEVWIPPGAVAGIDGLIAARTAGLREVTYTSIKPPVSWEGTPAASKLAGNAREQRTILFEGTAREAALQYPQNANVGATIALAGLGLDRTTVRLVSDPAAMGPLGVIEAAGDFGTFRFEILAYASPANPKTSTLTAHSLFAALSGGSRLSVLPLLSTRCECPRP
jgi:aspartate dehydrogenase